MTDANLSVSFGSGNVYADLGYPDAEEMLVKAKLTYVLDKLISQRGWSRAQAAGELAVDELELAALFNGHFQDVLVERLLRFLNALDHDVEILVEPKKAPQRHATVAVRSSMLSSQERENRQHE